MRVRKKSISLCPPFSVNALPGPLAKALLDPPLHSYQLSATQKRSLVFVSQKQLITSLQLIHVT